ncbi:hypothetical protein [Nonomuraea basaltis]|uniref:hypothetical protein n=1 Tax=Nonomuraea basaltis TaxID=2495887 RepID=UPI00198166B7|nr:hypothetical protein [Nonomuraea basaltis]
MIDAVGQFQRDLQNELTAEGIAAAEAEGRYRGRPPALTGTQLEEVRSMFTDQGASIAALARAHGVSRDGHPNRTWRSAARPEDLISSIVLIARTPC